MIRQLLLFLVLLLLFSYSAHSEVHAVITGEVVNVADGDTITIVDRSKSQHTIRLYGIDAPEKGQAFGNAAKKFASKLAYNKTAEVTAYDIDKYGRTVGVVIVNGVNVNQSLIEAGYAWLYRKYCKESFCDNWLGLEEKARSARMGLWADKSPIAPWDWRKGNQGSTGLNNLINSTNAVTIGGYHGNVKSHVFHRAGCKDYDCKNCIQNHESKEAALESGYRPCGRCRP